MVRKGAVVTELQTRLTEAAAKVAASLDERDAVVAFAYRHGGMSLRDIAKVSGVSHEQVRRICSKDLNLADELHRANP